MAIFFCTVRKRRSKRITSTERRITALFSILKKRQELGYTLFSADQKTLSPMAEIFLLCGNVYLSFGQNQGSALSR